MNATWLLMLLAATPAQQQPADPTWLGDGRPAASDPSQAAKDGLAVKMLLTDDHDGFWAEWDKPSPPRISTTEQITREKPVFAIILFAGCKAGADGNCDVAVEYRITRPDGSPYGEAHNAEAWRGPPAPAANVQASTSTLGFNLDPPDPFGAYTISATVTDKIAGIAVAVEKRVMALESKS